MFSNFCRFTSYQPLGVLQTFQDRCREHLRALICTAFVEAQIQRYKTPWKARSVFAWCCQTGICHGLRDAFQQWAAFNHHRLLTLLQPQLQAQSWLLLASKSLSDKIPEGQDFRSCYLKPQQFSGLWFYKGFLLICFTFFGKGIRILKKPLGEQWGCARWTRELSL